MSFGKRFSPGGGAAALPFTGQTSRPQASRLTLLNGGRNGVPGAGSAAVAIERNVLQFSTLTQEAARFVKPTSAQFDSAVPAEDHDLFYQGTKRIMDFGLALGAIIALTPVLAVIAALVAVTDPGPIFFKQNRLGARGKVFKCIKFRTMVTNAEKLLKEDPELMKRFAADFKIKDDPRITRIGAFLRKTSLDELPQLFNILSGDMSFVGPRPIIPVELQKYGAFGEKLLSVKPGLGGVWQACGRSEISYSERIGLDMIYVDNCSIKVDLELLFMTASSVFRKSDAY